MKSLINTLKKRDIKILDRCTNLILSYSYKGPVFSYHRGGGGGGEQMVFRRNGGGISCC